MRFDYNAPTARMTKAQKRTVQWLAEQADWYFELLTTDQEALGEPCYTGCVCVFQEHGCEVARGLRGYVTRDGEFVERMATLVRDRSMEPPAGWQP